MIRIASFGRTFKVTEVEDLMRKKDKPNHIHRMKFVVMDAKAPGVALVH